MPLVLVKEEAQLIVIRRASVKPVMQEDNLIEQRERDLDRKLNYLADGCFIG